MDPCQQNFQRILAAIRAIFLVLLLSACGGGKDKNTHSGDSKESSQVIIFHAGSLSAPFKQIAREFEEQNPGAQVLLEAAGSVDCARKITELNKPSDLMASSDYKVIEKFLIPGYTSWHIPFATNEMVIAYHEDSRRSGEIDRENWMDILLDPGVRYGRSDPGSDPCGYRTLMTFQLSEKYYDSPGLEKNFMAKDIRYIRPKEVDLIALLEVGEIDYFFVYRSVALQHNLKYISLPKEVNLKDLSLAGLYKEASVKIPGNRPGDSLTIHGEPMVYAITMINNAPHPELAVKFLDFLLDPEKGIQVMEQMGQEPVVPSQSVFYDSIPDELKKYVKR